MLTPQLERLNALLVLVCDVKGGTNCPLRLSKGSNLFASRRFRPVIVMALVRQRLASVGVMDSDFTMQMQHPFLDGCDGYRLGYHHSSDAVDSIRMAQSNDGPSLHLDTSARIQPRDEPETLRRLMGNAPMKPCRTVNSSRNPQLKG